MLHSVNSPSTQRSYWPDHRAVHQLLSKATLLLAMASLLQPATAAESTASESTASPNFVIIFCDDLGYGDLGCFGHPSIATPQLDRMAAEGMRWTQFYAAAEVCTPSRAGLLTGRLPPRSGMCSNKRRVLFPDSKGGLPADEVTIAELLKTAGYRTGCVGKWHLGHQAEFLPTAHGFDTYYGIPYSNDMDRVPNLPKGTRAIFEPKSEYFNVPILRGTEVIERPADQTQLTKRYTEEAIEFIRGAGEQPFFLYLAHSMPHVPLFRSQPFAGQSLRGLYGDVIEEIDWSVGEILAELRSSGLDQNTYVIFTSDNGPWLSQGSHGGSAGLLRDGKGTTFEGGMREPTIMWAPGRIAADSTSNAIGSTTDLLATLASLANVEPPNDRVLDSIDLTPVLHSSPGEPQPSPRESMFYYRGYELMAVRVGPWKVHYKLQGSYGSEPRQLTDCDPPEVYHLEHDPSERYNIAKEHPEVIDMAAKIVAEHQALLVVTPSQLEL